MNKKVDQRAHTHLQGKQITSFWLRASWLKRQPCRFITVCRLRPLSYSVSVGVRRHSFGHPVAEFRGCGVCAQKKIQLWVPKEFRSDLGT